MGLRVQWFYAHRCHGELGLNAVPQCPKRYVGTFRALASRPFQQGGARRAAKVPIAVAIL